MKWVVPTVAGLCLAADLVSKAWARANLTPGVSQAFWPGLLRLTITTNSGAAFGVGSGSGWLMTVLAITILAAVMVWVFQRQKLPPAPPLYEPPAMGFLIAAA